jgi:hypothetical protein
MKGLRRKGQVVVEMMLILPVFLTIVFTIMEMGNLAFQVIVLNHATYEVARIAGMTRMPKDPYSAPRNDCSDLKDLMNDIIKTATVDCFLTPTLADTQPSPAVMNQDVVVTGTYAVPFVFPLSSMLMSSKLLCPKGPGNGRCFVSARVRMPVERPLQN